MSYVIVSMTDPTRTETTRQTLERLGACSPSLEWLGSRSPEVAWNECPRGDWLLWVASKAGLERKVVCFAACQVARSVLHLVPSGEERPRIAIETAEAWCRGEATIGEVRSAAHAAAPAAAHVAYAAAAAYADSAAYAAYAATRTTDAAEAAAYAADAASRERSLQASANIVRACISWGQVEAALRGTGGAAAT